MQAAGSSTVSSSDSSASNSSSAGSSSGGSSSGSLDPWVLAEGVLLVRAQRLLPETAAAHQFATVLRYSQQACRQWWQQLHCSGDLVVGSSSYKKPSWCKPGSPAESVRCSQFDSAVELLLYILQQQRLLPAVKPHAASAMQVLLSAAAAAVATKGGEGVPMVMKCLTAAKGLVHLVYLLPGHSAVGDGLGQQWLQRLQHQHQQVLQQRQQLLLQHQHHHQQAGGTGSSDQEQEQQGVSLRSQQQHCTAGPDSLQLPVLSAADNAAGPQQHKQQHTVAAGSTDQHQQQQGAPARIQQHQDAAGPSSSELLGSLLHLLQQLLLVNDLLHLPDDAFDSCSSGNSDGTHSSSGSNGNDSSSSSRGDRADAAGALEPTSSEGEDRDAPLLAIVLALPLLLDLLDPLLLDHLQLMACLQQQQQHGQQLLEQVTWALQVTEAAVRALVAAGITPLQQERAALLAEHQAKHCDSPAPAGALHSRKLQQLQSRLETLMADRDIMQVLSVLSSRIDLVVQLPGAWEGLRSSVQGQQLLQAVLSLLMAHKEVSLGKVLPLPTLLMQLVSRDIRAFLAATVQGSCPAESSRQQQQLLPHPQLVVSVLALAALRYKQLHKQLLQLSNQPLVRPDGSSNYESVYLPGWLLAGDLAPRSAADNRQAADAAAAAAIAARKEAAVGSGAKAAALEAGAALLAGDGEAAAAGVGGEYQEVKDVFSTYSSTVHELLHALRDLSTAHHSTIVAAVASHNLHKQQQQQQQDKEQDVQQQDQQQQEQPQQQLLPEWVVLLQGSALKVLLPALFQATGDLNAAVAAVMLQLQQWRQGAETQEARCKYMRLSAQLSTRLNGLLETMAATRKQLEQPGLKAKRRSQLQGLYNRHELELSECKKGIEELEQKLLPLPRPVLIGLAKSVHVVGTLLSLLPSRFHCNNFDCTSLSTVSEGFALVRGSSCVCGGCVAGLAGSEATAREVPAARWVWGQVQRVGGRELRTLLNAIVGTFARF
jgi:hypothetical protein